MMTAANNNNTINDRLLKPHSDLLHQALIEVADPPEVFIPLTIIPAEQIEVTKIQHATDRHIPQGYRDRINGITVLPEALISAEANRIYAASAGLALGQGLPADLSDERVQSLMEEAENAARKRDIRAAIQEWEEKRYEGVRDYIGYVMRMLKKYPNGIWNTKVAAQREQRAVKEALQTRAEEVAAAARTQQQDARSASISRGVEAFRERQRRLQRARAEQQRNQETLRHAAANDEAPAGEAAAPAAAPTEGAATAAGLTEPPVAPLQEPAPIQQPAAPDGAASLAARSTFDAEFGDSVIQDAIAAETSRQEPPSTPPVTSRPATALPPPTAPRPENPVPEPRRSARVRTSN